jgi:hypothetical protein
MALSYAKDIRPMIRQKDIDCMKDNGPFDLSNIKDVRAHAKRIYQRLSAKEMPQDGPWTDDKIARFKQWMDEGMAD